MARCSEETTPRGAHHHQLDKPAGRWSGADDDDSELDVFAAERYFNGDDALWCARCSSSSFSSAFRAGTHEHDRSVVTTTAAATSSSEASWNSRSALLPAEGKRALADAPGGEAEFRGTTGSEPHREKPQPPPSHLRRWLLGVAGCACIGSSDDVEDDLASADDDEVEGGKVAGVGGEKLCDGGAGEPFESRTKSKELAVAEATPVRARPASKWLDKGEDVLAGEAAVLSRILLAGDGHHGHATKSGEFSAPTLNPSTAAALLHEQRRRKSPEKLQPLGNTRSALPSSAQHDSAFTIVAGNTAGGGRSATPRWPGTTSRCDWTDGDDDSAAPIELVVCPYPPSEASVDWSVVTAEGAASCNFSSAASGYYHLNGGASQPAAGRSDNRRRRCSVVTNSGGLLTCMGGKAVDAVGPGRSEGRNGRSVGYPEVTRRR